MKLFVGVLLLAVFVFNAVSSHGQVSFPNGYILTTKIHLDITLDQYEVVSVNLGDTIVKVYHNRQIFPEHHKRGSIFFAHGNSASHKVWEHQLTDESFNRRFNLYAVDFPGHVCPSSSANPSISNPCKSGCFYLLYRSKLQIHCCWLCGLYGSCSSAVGHH